MQLYNVVGNRLADDPKIIKNARTQKILTQIIGTIGTCGNGLERLPEPPRGAEAADQHFREFGKDILAFASILNDLTEINGNENKRKIAEEVRTQKERLKHDFHEAIQSFELVYPGRLTRALQSPPPNPLNGNLAEYDQPFPRNRIQKISKGKNTNIG